VAVAATAWAFFVCRVRRRYGRAGAAARTTGGILDGLAHTAGYKGVFTSDPDEEAERRSFRRPNGDLEAADFDENELDDLGSASDEQGPSNAKGKGRADAERENFAVDEDDDEEQQGLREAMI